MLVTRMSNLLGNYASLISWQAEQNPLDYSILDAQWSDIGVWRARARELVHSLLAFSPPSTPLDPRVERAWSCDGLDVELVSYRQPFGPRTEAYFIKPAGVDRLPAVLALHDHGAYKYHGKEKLVRLPAEPSVLTAFRQESYEGSPWATELARRGFAVLVPDLFCWGSRRLDPAELPDDLTAGVSELEPESDAYIRAYNDLSNGYESFIAKSLFAAGTTWPGVWAYEDRRAVDYLLTRPEIDPGRIGCGGLSCGGLRTIFLAGLDDRIQAALCVGFMSSSAVMAEESIQHHTWLYYVPHLHRHLDMPDLMGLHGPRPLLVQYDRDDQLWSMRGMEAAHQRLQRIYDRLGASGQYRGEFYPGPHKFDRAMQASAFSWFESSL